MTEDEHLLPLTRLALAYAPSGTRNDWSVGLRLDCRLGHIVLAAREPVLAQLKLAWWRDQLNLPAAVRAKGEPLLACLSTWPDEARALALLVDGWEALLGEENPSAAAAFIAGRKALANALAGKLGCDAGTAEARAGRWARADLALRKGDPLTLPAAAMRSREKAMRPLVVLEAVTCRAAARGSVNALTSPMALLTALRSGLLGV